MESASNHTTANQSHDPETSSCGPRAHQGAPNESLRLSAAQRQVWIAHFFPRRLSTLHPPGTHALSSPVDATAVTGAQSVKAVSADSAEATAEPWERAAGMSLAAAADVAAAKCVSRI